MIGLHELRPGSTGARPCGAGEVTIVAIESHGDDIVNVVFRGEDGNIAERFLTAEQAASVSATSGPFAVTASSAIGTVPHQIDAADSRPSALPSGLVTFLLTDIEGSTGPVSTARGSVAAVVGSAPRRLAHCGRKARRGRLQV